MARYPFLTVPVPRGFAVILILAGLLISGAPASAQTDVNLWFATETDTTQIFYTHDPRFLILVDIEEDVEGNPGAGDSAKADTLAVSLSTEQGDRETCLAVETEPASGRYVAAVALKGIRGMPTPDNHMIELDGSVPGVETVVLEATLDLSDGPETASMDLGFPKGNAIARKNRMRRIGGASNVRLFYVDGKFAHPRASDLAHTVLMRALP